MKKNLNPASELDEIPGDKLWKYAFSLHLWHYNHGLGRLALILTVVFAGIGACLGLRALVSIRTYAVPTGYIFLMIGCAVLTFVAWTVYKHFREKASYFASDCVDFGNKTYADARDYFCSCTGQELKA